MEIKRDRYLKKIISFMWDGQVKVITGIRRCGKSYLLRNLFGSYLLSEGVAEDHILSFELDLTRDIRYRNPLELASHVRGIVEHSAEQYYLFVDEIQMSDDVPNPYNPDGKKIFMIRDSYFSPVISFMAPLCGEVEAMWSLEDRDELDIEEYIRNNEFDCIIMEIYPYNINDEAFRFFMEEGE